MFLNECRQRNIDVLVPDVNESEQDFTVRVSDDGRGITPHEIRGAHSLGLLGLRERAIAMGGTVTIRRGATSGTTVALRLPMGTAAR